MRKTKSLIFGIIFFSICACAQKKEKDILIKNAPSEYTYEVVVPDLEIPWSFTWLPDGSMLINEKSGSLLHIKDGISTEVSNVPEVYTRGQGGLLDIELHPNYASNGWIYFTYASPKGTKNGGHTALSRAKLVNSSLTDLEVLYKGAPNTTGGNHFGSRIEFDDKGFVYFSIGERGERNINPQDINRDGGKIYRLNADGSIPNDNPFVNTKGAKKAIYSYGHRNPQGMTKHPKTGKIWVHEHGPQGGDEINEIKKGANFGWPIITYGVNYGGSTITNETAREGMEQPIYYWVPSIAPSGMTFVTSQLYPEWNNALLVGSLKFYYLELLKLNEDSAVIERQKLFEDLGRFRCVRQGPDGYIYAAVEDLGIIKVLPKK